eukprot:2089593-Prymnesium_polylepis.1
MAAAAVDALGSMENITDVGMVDAAGARSTKPEPARVRTDPPLSFRRVRAARTKRRPATGC